MENVYLVITYFGDSTHTKKFVQGIYSSIDGAVIAACDFAQSQKQTYIPQQIGREVSPNDGVFVLIWEISYPYTFVHTYIYKEKLKD